MDGEEQVLAARSSQEVAAKLLAAVAHRLSELCASGWSIIVPMTNLGLMNRPPPSPVEAMVRADDITAEHFPAPGDVAAPGGSSQPRESRP